ncbi:MAG TPA: glycosyltransferase, partial [Acetobacteraceae bacterium]|nr:glycosyltransferase [Acetobacteraceae bacterium]
WAAEYAGNDLNKHQNSLISIVIATHNWSDLLRRCLAGLASQPQRAGLFDAIIFDSNSTQGAAQDLEPYGGRPLSGQESYVICRLRAALRQTNARRSKLIRMFCKTLLLWPKRDVGHIEQRSRTISGFGSLRGYLS